MTALARVDALELVREQLDLARREGRTRPGRPALVKATGLTDHAVKTALARIQEDDDTTTDHQPPADHHQPTGADEHAGAGAEDHHTTIHDHQPATNGWRSPATPGDLATPAPAGDTPGDHQHPPTATTSTDTDHQLATSPGEHHQPSTSTSPPAHTTSPRPAITSQQPGAHTSPAPSPATPPAHQPGTPPGNNQPPPSPATDTNGAHQPPALATPQTPAAASPPAHDHHTAASTSGLTVSWCGFMFGSLVSIAANVLHTRLPPENHPAGWTPQLAPQLGAAVWPVALLLAVEVLSRVKWPHTWPWRIARYGGAGAVALGSGYISWSHTHSLLLTWHYDPTAAFIGPLVIDGLMTISGFALLTTKHTTTHTPSD